MKRWVQFAVVTAIVAMLPGLGLTEKPPKEIAGFTLGEQASTYSHLLRMETALPDPDMRYVTEAEAKHIDGYKSGSLEFGNCAVPGRILRIKLKYEYADKKFYEQLLERFKNKFGKPDEWRGDPFGAIIAWKWSFRDSDDNSISLILQHSTDEEYKYGNSVKITNTTYLREERLCYEKKKTEGSKTKGEKQDRKKSPKNIDLGPFIPR
jgi:hypothetical protein